MSSSPPPVSVIVRTKDSAATLGPVLTALRAQTVASEIIVVDSGSSDRTLEIADQYADRILTMAPEAFTFGGSLNLGARAASAPIHAALSSHSLPHDEGWLERSLSKYSRADVAATSAAPTAPGEADPLQGTYYQTLADARAHPWWGFSNTGATWRAEVWGQFPFDEQLTASEDKEWGMRVLSHGWTIAVDPSLAVGDTHRSARGLRYLYWRTRREFVEIASFAEVPPYTLRDLASQWLRDVPSAAPYRGWRRRLNPNRLVELAAKYQGLRSAR
jgi:rhamnosyltransferase